MRSVSGARNRIALALTGLVALLAAAWLTAAHLDLVASWPQGRAALAPAGARWRELAAGGDPWIVPAAAGASVLVVLAGVLLLLAQIPRRARTSPLRLTGHDGTLLATLDPQVMGRALSERAEEIPGVTSCSVWVAGSSRSTWLQATARIAQDAEVAWTVSDLRRRLADDAATALGQAPHQVDVLIRPHRTAVSRSITGARGTRQGGATQVRPTRDVVT
ncbi:hypothetical protein [Actinomyces capricornis]|uniref:Alkaline shock response membrane anchor protein AmaP n=1 Tax=Actinomyces capricornis TaxID=2755559 RepID=A0ABM7U8S2_9ACTO|nr:hypothetical protein [Actinomyces capricornis]BDA63868.1 hypothetical protein MANAM107_07020 [Actinomyces capricornis]